MTLIIEIFRELLEEEIHDHHGLADQEENREEKKEGSPDFAGERKAGVTFDATIPETSPTEKNDEAPKRIKKWDE